MPTYEYVCTSCGHRFEAVQSFSDPALTVCPVCEGELRKVFGNVGIVLKGSGFYKTDSRSRTKIGDHNGATKENKENKETKENKEKEPATSSSSSSESSTPKEASGTKSDAGASNKAATPT